MLSVDRVKSPGIRRRNTRFLWGKPRYGTWSVRSMESSKGDSAMTSGKTSAAVLGLVGGVVLGAWIGTELTMNREVPVQQPAAVTTQAVAEPTAPAAPAKPKRVVRAAPAASSRAAVNAPAPESAPKLVMTI